VIVPIGELRERIVIQRSTPGTSGPYGPGPAVWSDYQRPWARVRPRRGSEASTYEGPKVQAEYSVVIRYRKGITTADRLIWRGAVLSIASIADPDQTFRWLEMTCYLTEQLS
jgi:SPP1 family predicted phage head-tail adaptor